MVLVVALTEVTVVLPAPFSGVCWLVAFILKTVQRKRDKQGFEEMILSGSTGIVNLSFYPLVEMSGIQERRQPMIRLVFCDAQSWQ